MLLYLKISFLAIILCLIGESNSIVACDLREKECLISQKNLISVESKKGKITEIKNIELTEKSKSEILCYKIDQMVKYFENYESLSEQEQNELRDKWEDGVKKIVDDVKELKVQKFLMMHTASKDLGSLEELTIPNESKEKLKRVQSLYPREHNPRRHKDCVIF